MSTGDIGVGSVHQGRWHEGGAVRKLASIVHALEKVVLEKRAPRARICEQSCTNSVVGARKCREYRIGRSEKCEVRRLGERSRDLRNLTEEGSEASEVVADQRLVEGHVLSRCQTREGGEGNGCELHVCCFGLVV